MWLAPNKLLEKKDYDTIDNNKGNERRVLVLDAINAFFAAIGFSSGVASTIPKTFF